MFKAKNHLSPSFMNEMVVQNKGPSTRMGTTFVRPKVNSVYKGDNSLRIFGPIVWNNMLPERLKVCSSLSEFKNAIKSWIPENCTCRLCKHYVQGLGFIKQ